MNGQKQVVYEFGEFRMHPGQRVLMRHGELVLLMPKGFDTLLFLVQNAGRVIEKEELMKALWPESFVEESNLAQNIFVLRKTLGDDQNGSSFIKTIPRRGYKFVAPVKVLDIPTHVAQSPLPTEYWRQHSPFRGLQVFEPDDAWLFFGRDSETEDLLLRLGRSPVLMVIGNSGCGKSSLIRAGLVPALRTGRFPNGDEPAPSWQVAIVRPTGAPFDYLAEILPSQLAPELSVTEQAEFVSTCRKKLPSGGQGLRDAVSALANAASHDSSRSRVLLVVDQFEELFTLTSNRDVREHYIEALLAASRWDGCVAVHLVLVLRADFYSYCIDHPGLSRCLESNLYNVPRMTRDQLREAIEKRLELASAHAEAGLVDSLLEDVGTEPGNLALLEHALSQLWERCGGFGCTLASEAYSAIGRVRGALSAHADEVYGAINNDTQKRLVQKIFLELVQLGEGAPDTRRRVRKAELLSLSTPEQVEPLLARLTSSRLIAISGEGQEAFVEVSHEALIREWSTLREWITQNSEELLFERKLVQAAQEWESLSHDLGALLQGARLAQGEEWLTKHPDASAFVLGFLQASVAARVEAEQQELRRQKAAATRSRWFSCALACLLLVALGATWFAHRQQVLAESRALAAQSEEMLTRDQGQALNLAIRGWNIAKTQEGYVAVTKALPQTLNVLKHDGEIADAAFAPDGHLVVTASFDHTARVWNAADGRPLATLEGHTDKLCSAAFSPDGQRIVTASWDHTVRVWSSVNGHLLATLRHTDKLIHAEFSSNGQRIVTAGWDHTPRVWNSSDGRLLLTLQHTNVVRDAAFSPDGHRIVTASNDHTARVWNTADGRLLLTLQHADAVGNATFSPDSQRIVTASDDHTARVWNAGDGRLLGTLRHEGPVIAATFSPDGRHIATASSDHTARLWNTADGRLLATLPHDGRVQSARFSPDSRYVVTASDDGTARVWNADDGRLLATLQGHNASVWDASFSSDNQRILTTSADHTARIWNIAGARLLSTLSGHTDEVRATMFSQDNQRILTASFDHTARIWSTSNGRLLATLEGHTGGVYLATFSSDNQRILTASYDHTARVWNAANGHMLLTLQGHTDAVEVAAFSSDGQRIVTASWDHTARVWNAADGHLLATLQGHTDILSAATFSPDGHLVVTASFDHTARVWNAADGRLLFTLQGHADKVWDAAFSPDSKLIVTASEDHTARVWSAADGRLLFTLQGHADRVWAVTFSPDSRCVATASWDHTTRIWNTADGRLLAALQGHAGPVQRPAFSRNGKLIVTASDDQTARVWSATDGRLLATLQGHTASITTARFSPNGQLIVTGSADQTARVWQVLTLDDIEKILKQ